MLKQQITPSVRHFSLPETPAAVLDITTSTRYYRTSLLTEVRLITLPSENETPKETVWTLEKESDDFDILVELAAALAEVKLIVTFNGTSFDVPHLTKKYEAYRLEDPFKGKHFIDLFLKFKKFDPLLQLSSHRLADYMALFPENELPEAASDAERELLLTSLLPLEGFLAGNFTVDAAHVSGDSVTFALVPYGSLPVKINVEDGPFRFSLDGDKAHLTAALFTRQLRRYYTNVSDYEFLTKEGYAVHKSVSAGVGKDRKERAVRENCFSFFRCSEKFLGDEAAIKRYVVSVFSYMMTR